MIFTPGLISLMEIEPGKILEPKISLKMKELQAEDIRISNKSKDNVTYASICQNLSSNKKAEKRSVNTCKDLKLFIESMVHQEERKEDEEERKSDSLTVTAEDGSTSGTKTDDSGSTQKKKKKKNTPRRLTPEERRERRYHQVELGKKSIGYQNYIRVIPRERRLRYDPQTPPWRDVTINKRRFDGLISAWRRKLHDFDDISNPANPRPKLINKYAEKKQRYR